MRGAIYDVIVDIRPGSPTYLMCFGAILSAANGLMMYVPEGFAHGYQTLEHDSTAFDLVSTAHAPGSEGGLRYDDPRIGVHWPLAPKTVSVKDANWPLIAVGTAAESPTAGQR